MSYTVDHVNIEDYAVIQHLSLLGDPSFGDTESYDSIQLQKRLNTDLLLLLIGVISSHLPEVQARPTDFWCNGQARKSMEIRIDELKKNMANCVGSDTLSSPVQLPCVWVNPTEWANTTLQQKCAEVVGALQMFRDGVQGARNQSISQCQILVLEQLEHHITNFLAIVSRLQTQNDTAVQNCPAQPGQTSLNKVVDQYTLLLKGKMNHLAIDLQDSICKDEQRTTNTHDGPLG